ncbi:hypothetical protein J7E93_27110 [Streptomyces sp. ISL-36]|uniref:hypothetical protein n=1 Tax=Streptomyces sp. ISL-36 TaxID=2819182 RepID=UPI001BECE9D7|nr:hypothetical protein [Streptomyces sp. ISL-36]MBT2443700.1 hypothetical protein [Streptomyces sp. ISL-36]
MAGTVLTNTGLDAFLDGTPEPHDPSYARAADAVLGLLSLRGADRRSGLPEPTVGLVRRLLVEDAPAFVYATPEELAAYPAVLVALTERVRQAGRLNGKRQARIVAAIEETVPDFERAMTDPANLTWQRWYASLLRADGVDPRDPAAVRAWLAAHDGVTPPDGLRRADLMNRSEFAGMMLAEVLTGAYVREAEAPSPAGPLLSDGDVSHGVVRVAGDLVDRWTAQGLSGALAGPYAHLAPGPEAFPHLVLADTLLDEHLDYYGDSWTPLPPPPMEAHDPQRSVEAGADLLAAAVEEMKADETGGLYDGEAAHLLYALYQRGSTAESVARRAAEFEDWPVDPRLEDAPVLVPAHAPEEYRLPPVAELSRLVGSPVTEDDRARLEPSARAMAAAVDRLAATGMVFRIGDAFGLTPWGVEVLHYLLRVRGVAAPAAAEAAAWDAPTIIAAAEGWSASAAARVLADWLRARGDSADAWSQLLAALGTVHAGTHDAAATRALFGALDPEAAPVEALRGALDDPVMGAYACGVLRARGEPADETRVPLSARAVLVLDRLSRRAAAHTAEHTSGRTAGRSAFDTAAESWPGGADALVAQMAAVDPHGAARTLEALGITLPVPGARKERARRRRRVGRRAR